VEGTLMTLDPELLEMATLIAIYAFIYFAST
jgi:hypothetical protein